MAVMTADIGIVTVSDRAHSGEYEDRGGPAIEAWLSEVLVSPWGSVCRLVPDEQPHIETVLKELCDDHGCGREPQPLALMATGPCQEAQTAQADRQAAGQPPTGTCSRTCMHWPQSADTQP